MNGRWRHSMEPSPPDAGRPYPIAHFSGSIPHMSLPLPGTGHAERATQMFREAAQSPAVVAAQLERNAAAVARLARRLREVPPRAVVTCARGSSDHAATFAKYLVESRLGVLVASAAPSISSVYGVRSHLRDCLFLAISQSGRSPDLLATTEAAREAGAHVVALVNEEDAPLSSLAHCTLPLAAGREESVGATKSYVAALSAMLHVVAEWGDDEGLRAALRTLPADLERAWSLDWSPLVARLREATHLYIVGRGLGLAVAQETALKCKETCGLHAEGFSSAEVRHGPQALLRENFPALLLAQDDATLPGVVALARELAERGVAVALAGAQSPGVLVLPTVAAHAAVEPLLRVVSAYRMANALAIARGRDPDRPPHLRKVTETH
jgi:glutamine---fructose-6-phosphate transaminase (isomerizing)